MIGLADAAREYVALALPVIALNGKRPNGRFHPHGLNEPFTTPSAELLNAVTHSSTTGVGIVIPYPYVVVDIDGEEGAQAWMRDFGDIPDRWVAKTGRGLHMWYASIEPCGNGKLAEKLDLKGQGGYVVAPPSLHPDGHHYEWIAEPAFGYPPMEVPEPLQRWIALRNADRARAQLQKDMLPRVRHSALEDGMLYSTLGWDGLIKGMAEAGEGNRNNYLHWAAASMATEGAVDEDLQSLYDAAVGAGLTQREARLTIRSAMKAAGR